MANRRLVERKLVSDLADTERGWLLHEQLKHPQPRRVGDGLEAIRKGDQPLRMVGCGLWRWRAARRPRLTDRVR
jgi:hypothetical protein